MAFLEQTIDWGNYADSNDKVAFFKEFIQFFGKDELNCVRGILNRKRKKDFTSDDDAPRSWKGRRLFTGRSQAPVRSPSNDVIPPGEAAPAKVDEDKPTKSKWTDEIDIQDFVAFDVEAAQRYVKFLDPNGKMWTPNDQPPRPPHVQENEPMTPKAAYVSIVDYTGRPIYEGKIQHLPGTFRVDYWTKTTANISSTSQLKNGKPFETVVKEFLMMTQGKYIITCGGGNDFRYLEINPTSFRRFDLQAFYQRPSKDNPEKYEPMSLRDIYFYHFKEDFQRGAHNATVDAKATIKIFIDGYCKLDLETEHDFSAVPNLKQKAAKGLFYCKSENAFTKKCNCLSCNNVEI